MSIVVTSPPNEPEEAAQPTKKTQLPPVTSSSPKRTKSLRYSPTESQNTSPTTKKRAMSSSIYNPAEADDDDDALRTADYKSLVEQVEKTPNKWSANLEYQVHPSVFGQMPKMSVVRSLAQQFNSSSTLAESKKQEDQIEMEGTPLAIEPMEDQTKITPTPAPEDNAEYLTAEDETYLPSQRSQSWNANEKKAKAWISSKELRASSSEIDIVGACGMSAIETESEKKMMEPEKREDDAHEKGLEQLGASSRRGSMEGGTEENKCSEETSK
ncbi:hypothetical protein LDENG_00216180 [Lucifuga dentata]|nr:hypothetical protein LDENG_00216180 [Lucifuga dentata]